MGVGYSVAVNGKPVQYPDKSYGLVGHVLIDPEGPRCTSGHIGCSQCLTDDSIAEQYAAIVGRAVSFEDFARDAKGRVPQATQLVNRTCFRLGSLVATVANIAMPGHVLIAGESAFLAKLGTDSLRDGIRFYRHSQTQPVKFTIMNHDWQLWAKAAASRVIVKHIGPFLAPLREGSQERCFATVTPPRPAITDLPIGKAQSHLRSAVASLRPWLLTAY